MIVFCEECGARNIIDPENVKIDGKPIRCVSCKDILRFSMTQTIRTGEKTTLQLESSSSKPPSEKPVMLLPSRLELRLGDNIISINQTRPSVTMGRQEHNDLEVIDTRVSRSHARIEYRKGQFFLVDHSTNGTYVQIFGRQGVNLRRSELALEGSGIITLGRKVSPDSPKAIHFMLKS